MDVIRPGNKCLRMTSENPYISLYQTQNILIYEQETCDRNPRCELLQDTAVEYLNM